MEMFSIFQREQTYEMQLFNALMFCLIAFLFWNTYITKFDSSVKKRNNFWFSLLFLIYALTPTYTGDFWGYKSLVEIFTPQYGTWHLEELYQNLLRIIGPNYLLFRIIVWGGAEFLFIKTCSRFGVEPYRGLFLLFCLFVTKFVYARVTLAMAVYFFGLSYICKPIDNKRTNSIILGILIILLSSFFHRSIIVVILFTPILFFSLSKKRVKLILFLIPIIIILIRFVLTSYASLILEEDYADKAQSYSTANDLGDTSKSTNLLFWWGCLPFFTSFFTVTYLIFKRKTKEQISRSLILLYRLVFGITIFSYCCYFVRPENPTLFYRFLYMSMIPLVIIIVEMCKIRIINRRLLIILALIGLSPDAATFFFRVFMKFTPLAGH